MIETDVLIVGAGPAGASAAVFLGRYGVSVLMISRHRSTAETPRAHITNQRAMEALRDAGLERECMAQASPSAHFENCFWLRSLAGEELARVYAWGNDPLRKGDYEAASPCSMSDLPQTKLEPILVTEAARLGAQVRFSAELLSFDQDETGITARVLDGVSGEEVLVRAVYMIGADGARSQVVDRLGLPLNGRSDLGEAMNVFFDADLTDLVQYRPAAHYITLRPGNTLSERTGTLRMVRPWDQWLATFQLGDTDEPLNEAAVEARVRAVVGLCDVELNLRHISTWKINSVVAERYALGRVYCMGDAVHRHSPANGLGSNTCIQDAFNLAWKLAFVLQGRAGRELLDSYDAERQPVGRQIVARATKSLAHNRSIATFLLGEKVAVSMTPSRVPVLETSEGRAELRRRLDGVQFETHAHGVEMNRDYRSSAVVGDESLWRYERDEELFYQPGAHAGRPLPHAWLIKRAPGPRVSTLDVAGKGRFTLFVGPGGAGWREAAEAVRTQAGEELAVVAIGAQMDFEDPYGRWNVLSGIEEDGCILVRPDLYVAWVSINMPDDPNDELDAALRAILSLK